MPLDPNRFTRKTGEALQSAQALAREQNQSGSEEAQEQSKSEPGVRVTKRMQIVLKCFDAGRGKRVEVRLRA